MSARRNGGRAVGAWVIPAIAGAAILVAVAAIVLLVAEAVPTAKRPNLLLVSFDTLRADHLGCYGYGAPTSPGIDAFAAGRGVLFETAVAAAPSTTPSHASMLTSLLPTHHGAFFSRRTPLAHGFVTLAERLAAAGYRTFSVNDGGQVDAVWGLAQGFDDYITLPGGAKRARFEETAARALEWFDDTPRDRPWFAFLHTYETHHPYEPTPEFYRAIGHEYAGPLPGAIDKALLSRINDGGLEIDGADVAHIIAAYDAEIRSMDTAFVAFLAALERRGLMDDTVVILTSDHGEELGERGMMGWHSHALYDEQLLVPLIIRLPDERFAGTRIEEQVRGIDLMPTALDLLGLAPQPGAEGRTVMTLIAGASDAPRPAVSQRDVRSREVPSSLRSGGRKLHRAADGATMAFDLAADPGERNDLAKVEEEATAQAVTALEAILAARPEAPSIGPVAVGGELEEKLVSLGYLDDDAVEVDE